MKKIALFATLLVVVLFLPMCRKNKKYDNSSAPRLNAIVENAYSEMTNMTDQAIRGNMVYYKSGTVILDNVQDGKPFTDSKAACNVVITIDTLGTTKTVTIDWGSNNCDCNDGKQRRGKIVTTLSGSYYAQGTVITHTPVDYYVNNNKIEGTKVVTNMGPNSSGQPYYSVVIDGVVTMSSGEIVTYHSTRTRTFVTGFSTPLNFWDDEYDITGFANASVSDGDSYMANITLPLHIKIGCGFITSGTLDITPSGKPTRTINYGDGTCDATFTITVNGNTYTING
jgi:hypothetical protein